MLQRIFLILVLLGLTVLWCYGIALAGWPGNANVNVPICIVPDKQENPTIASDGSGGAIITWQDYRNGNYDIYAQRVDVNGAIKWSENGVPICTDTGKQERPTIVSDGSGGAIITWQDNRSGYKIYAQRVDAFGAALWDSDGVTVCTGSSYQFSPIIVSDGSGGAIIAWGDNRNSSWDIYAQCLNASGDAQWDPNGVPICTAPDVQSSSGRSDNLSIVSDGSGGAIITWMDGRNGIPQTRDIYAQRVDVSGAVRWTINGVPICTASGDQIYPKITSDGSGGAIITWMDGRSGNYIYAQRVNASGTVQWTANGVAITAPGNPAWPTIASDGFGGAIIAWYESDIYAQRVANGAIQWTPSGVPICTAQNNQHGPIIVSDGSNGAIITWQDERNGNWDLYAQRVDANGAVEWAENGVPICTAQGNQYICPIIVSDSSNGAIITWTDERNGNLDIYAQRVFSDGSLTETATITGTVLYNGEPITNYTDKPATFFARNINTGEEFQTFQYDNINGTYSIPDVTPGSYAVCAYIDDAEPFDGRYFPGDYRGCATGFEVPSGVVNKDIDCPKIIHLTSPVDNLSTLGYTSDPYDIYYQNKILFHWDVIPEASVYEIKVDQYQSSPYQYVYTIIPEYTISNNQVTIYLPNSSENQHYQFYLHAQNADGLTIGELMVVYDNGFGVDYRFRTAQPMQTQSIWAATSPTIDGIVSPGEWDAALRYPMYLLKGQVLVQNDNHYLYLLVDLTGDTNDDGPEGDYFWLTFDVGSDKKITPYEDINYGCRQGSYNFGLQYYLGPGEWTGLFETISSLGVGFGPSQIFQNHRIWEFAISLEEIKVNPEDWLADPAAITPIRSGLKTYSQNPSFDDDYPLNFMNDFSNLIEIFPALGPILPTQPVILGVGAVPATEIVDGYANTAAGYVPELKDAPFGGALRIFGNFDYLHGKGAAYYKVWYKQIDAPSAVSAPLLQSWTQYRWDIDRFVPYTITYKDVSTVGLEDVYEIPPGTEILYPANILILWSSWYFPNGKYQLWLEAFDQAGSIINLSAEPSSNLTLAIDNTQPQVKIIEITHGDEVVGGCDIVYLADPPDGLRFKITAWDDNTTNQLSNPRHLLNYSLAAYYGDNESQPIYSDNYDNNDGDAPIWGGVKELVIPVGQGTWRPPKPCAYQFRLSARDRATDGYSYIHYSEYNKHVTILFGEEPSCNPGDVSGDGNVTAYDAALILQFVVGLINEFPVSAVQSPTDAPQRNYSVAIPEITARVGNRIRVPITINDTTGLTAGGIVVKYDPSVLRAVDFTASSLLNGAYWKANIERVGEVRFAFATAEPTQGTGNLLMVEFEVLPNTAGKISHVVFDTVNLVNSFTITKIDGLVTVLPEHTALLPNFPNPFNPETWIPYQLSQDVTVVIQIYNQKGQTVRTIDLGQQIAGSYVTKDRAVYWDGTNNFGERVASGTYFYTLQAGKFTATRRMLIIK
jgi:hypothetical protein